MGSAALTYAPPCAKQPAGGSREAQGAQPRASDDLGGCEGRLKREGLRVDMLSVHAHTRLMHVLVQRKPI